MSLVAGTKLGPYEILDAIGAGGMGEVYRAKDMRLERTVAIKVLPEHLSADEQRRERFQREAKTISGLSHPNICALYDVGEKDGSYYLVLEHLEGESLAARLVKGALTIEETVKVGAEIASALETAHRSGVVHRDLKPANVMLTKSGAKLLDFGLAKPGAALLASAAGATEGATLSKSLTEEGTIVGTFQYMAPEQLEGQEADARTDLFALGEILYEMATGKAAFQGKTKVSLIANILSSEPPPVATLAPLTPPLFERVVKTCLAKEPEERFQSAHDVLLQLRWIAEGGSQIGAAPAISHKKKLQFRAATIAAAVSLTALVATYAVLLLRPKPAPPPAVRGLLQPAKGATFGAQQLAISPDGSVLVYRELKATGNQLFVHTLASATDTAIANSEAALWPFFSPDNKHMGFCNAKVLQKLDLAGGAPLTLVEGKGCQGGSWGVAGTIVFSSEGAIRKVAEGGGESEVVIPRPKDAVLSNPYFLPDGRHFLFHLDPGSSGLQHGHYVADLKTGKYSFLVPADTTPWIKYASGYLLYNQQGELMAQPFDADKLKLTGDKVVVGPSAGSFAATEANVLAYFLPTGKLESELRWMSRGGGQTGKISAGTAYDNPRLSPDGSKMAYQQFDATTGTGSVWIYDLKRDLSARLTFGEAQKVASDEPVWSPDGKRIAYFNYSDQKMHMKASSGLGQEEIVLDGAYPTDWSPDGKFILYQSGDDYHLRTAQVGLLQLEPQKSSKLLLNTPGASYSARFSPDGKFIAYTSTESDKEQVYVVPYPSLAEKWQVSPEGGREPVWSREGKELFYLAPDGQLMSVAVSRKGEELEFGKPAGLFATSFTGGPGQVYDVFPGGQKFVVNSDVATIPNPMTIVSNWTSLIKK